MNTRIFTQVFFVLVLITIVGGQSWAQDFGDSFADPAPSRSREVVKLKTTWSANAARPGDVITLAISMQIQEP